MFRMSDYSNRGAAVRHLTTRRGFVTLTSLGGISLYGLWAGLGAAPLRFWEAPESAGGGMDMDHGGHGGATGPSADAFRKTVAEFVAAHQQADGSVLVDAAVADAMPGMDMSGGSTGMADMPGMDMSGSSGQAMDHHDAASVPAVFMLAEKWAFEPAWIKLRAGVAYKMTLMALDAAHGASLQLGPASQIIRLPKGVLVEREMTFTRPGTYLVYCTMYCGEGHQLMSGKIEVL
jgi:cytochrome c oxidase subunit II